MNWGVGSGLAWNSLALVEPDPDPDILQTLPLRGLAGHSSTVMVCDTLLPGLPFLLLIVHSALYATFLLCTPMPDPSTPTLVLNLLEGSKIPRQSSAHCALQQLEALRQLNCLHRANKLELLKAVVPFGDRVIQQFLSDPQMLSYGANDY